MWCALSLKNPPRILVALGHVGPHVAIGEWSLGAPQDSAKVVTVEWKGNQAAERRVAAIRYSY
jgi:hypothetical protein